MAKTKNDKYGDNIMATIKDPVQLSGGDLGGQIVDGSKWKINSEKEFQGYVYRRLEDDGEALTSDKAVYVGKKLSK